MILATKIIVASIFLAAIFWDVIAVCINKCATISKIALNGASDYQSITLTLGFLLGHLFWPMIIASELDYWKYSLPFVVVFLIAIVVIDLMFGFPDYLSPIMFLLFGIIAGHFLWPQKI